MKKTEQKKYLSTCLKANNNKNSEKIRGKSVFILSTTVICTKHKKKSDALFKQIVTVKYQRF